MTALEHRIPSKVAKVIVSVTLFNGEYPGFHGLQGSIGQGTEKATQNGPKFSYRTSGARPPVQGLIKRFTPIRIERF